MINKCAYCEKLFEKDRVQKYCSYGCNGKASRTRITKPCEYCGKDFVSEPHKNRRFCSHTCSGAERQKDKVKAICLFCNKEFCHRACVPNSKYCSKQCAADSKKARENRKCKQCQKDFYPGKKTSQYCSTECKYAAYPRQGYKETYIKNLPLSEQVLFAPMFDKSGRVHEHRLIAARKVGRPLSKTEIVHHLNGFKRDNRPENLELLESKKQHHTGYGDVYYEKYEEMKSILELLKKKHPEIEGSLDDINKLRDEEAKLQEEMDEEQKLYLQIVKEEDESESENSQEEMSDEELDEEQKLYLQIVEEEESEFGDF